MVELEAAVGSDLRDAYAGMGYRAIRTALSRRMKAVVVSCKVVRNWQLQYASVQSVRRRPAALALKRPASVLPEATERPTGKRRAASSGAGPVSEVPASPTCLQGAKAVEEACGEKYRRDVFDFGIL